MQENAVRVNAENVDAICKKMEGVKDLTQHKQQIRYLARYLAKTADQRTQTWLNIAEELQNTLNDDEFKLSIMLSRIVLISHTEPREKTDKLRLKGLAFAREIEQHEMASGVLVALGYSANTSNDYEQGYKYHKEAVESAEKCGIIDQIIHTKANLIVSAINLKKSEEALALGQEVIRNAPKDDNSFFTSLSTVYTCLGTLAYDTSEYEKAIEYHALAVSYAKKCDRPLMHARANLGFAELLIKLNKLDNVNSRIDESIKIFEKFQSLRLLAEAGLTKAQLYAKQNKLERAVKVANQISLSRLKNEKEHQLAANIQIQLAEWYYMLKNLNKAQELLNAVFNFLEQQTDKDKLKQAHQLAFQIFESDGKIDLAFHHLKKYHELYKESFNEERTKTIAELETKFELTKKQQESDKHKLEKMEFQQMALRAQMNPHFIFNALNSIHDQILSHSKKSAAHYLRRFADLMRTILENSDSVSLSIENVVQFLKKYLEIEQLRFSHSFTFEITIDDEIEEDIMLIPAMVVQPYVENAIIHGISYVKEGRIEIDFLLLDDETIQCTVIDNGEGINASKSRSSKNHRSMSTNISKTRLENLSKQLNRNVSVSTIDLKDEDEDLSGTKVLITLPIL